MNRQLMAALLLSLLASAAGAEPQARINEVLDNFHRAAAAADRDTYLGLMTTDGVFLGTDATERWQGESWREFVDGYFSKGQGWTYTPTTRHVDLSRDGRSAWFDELLHNDSLGQCRGSGVLLLEDGQWRIAQYNLSVPIPNALVGNVVTDIRAATAPTATVDEVSLEPAATTGEAEAEPEFEEETEQKRCRKRHKTNSRANC